MAKIKELMKVEDLTTCESTAQMITKARRDGVELLFDRANDMKACPIGVFSACCKHCPWDRAGLTVIVHMKKLVFVGQPLTQSWQEISAEWLLQGLQPIPITEWRCLNLFKGVIEGKVKDFKIKDTLKLYEVAQSLGIETQDRELNDVARDLYRELELTYTQVDGEIPMVKRVPPKDFGNMEERRDCSERRNAGNNGNDAPNGDGSGSGL